MDFIPGIALAISIVTVAAIFIYAYIEEEKRRRLRHAALNVEAERLGMKITPLDARFDNWRIFDSAVQLKKGHSRYAYNVVRGYTGFPGVTAFDYHYAITTSTGKSSSTRHYHVSCVAIALPKAVPWLTVFEEGLNSKVAQFFGYDDIDFESKAFSDAYCVRSSDKRFAYDVISPAMMEHLMSRPGLVFEIAEGMLILRDDGTLSPHRLEAFINRAYAVRSLIPDRLFETS